MPTSLNRRIDKIRGRLERHPHAAQLRQRLVHLRSLQHRTHNGYKPPRNQPPQQTTPPPKPAPRTPIPYDPSSDTALTDARTTYNQETASLAGQKLQTEQAYGVAPGYNDVAANPYSQAALLQGTYDRSQKTTDTSYAAAGQLYAGSNQNARDYNRSNYGIASNTLLSKYQAALAKIANDQVSAQTDYQRARQDAYAQVLEDALATSPDPSEYPPVQGKSKLPSDHVGKGTRHGPPPGSGTRGVGGGRPKHHRHRSRRK